MPSNRNFSLKYFYIKEVFTQVLKKKNQQRFLYLT